MGGIVDSVGGFLGGLGESEQKQSGQSTKNVDMTDTKTGTQTSSGTQQKNPWEQQTGFLTDVWGQARDNVGWQADNVNMNQEQGWNAVADFAQGGAQDIFSGAQDQLGFLGSTDQLRPESNPFFQANIDAMTRAVQENLGRGLNQVNQQSVGANNLGGSRQGVAQGMAISDATEQAGDFTSQMAMENYQQGLQNMTNAAQMAPMLMEMGMAPGQMLTEVGNQQMQMQNPWEELMRYGQLVQAGNWGGTTDQTTEQTSEQESRRVGTETGTSSGTTTNQASPLDMFATFSNGMSNYAPI